MSGPSALGPQWKLALRTYRTPGTWLDKVRRATVQPNRDPLTRRTAFLRLSLARSRLNCGYLRSFRPSLALFQIELVS